MLDEDEYKVVTSKCGTKGTGSEAEIRERLFGPVLLNTSESPLLAVNSDLSAIILIFRLGVLQPIKDAIAKD